MTPEQIAQENARTGNTMAAIRGNAQRIGSSTTIPGSPKDVEAYGVYNPETNVFERDPNQLVQTNLKMKRSASA